MRKQLIVEFFDQQLWQFISIDEWLAANCQVDEVILSRPSKKDPAQLFPDGFKV